MIVVRLREMMERRGIRSQAELARLTGLSANSISSIAHGRGRLESIGRICAALDCQPGDLLEYVPENPSL